MCVDGWSDYSWKAKWSSQTTQCVRAYWLNKTFDTIQDSGLLFKPLNNSKISTVIQNISRKLWSQFKNFHILNYETKFELFYTFYAFYALYAFYAFCALGFIFRDRGPLLKQKIWFENSCYTSLEVSDIQFWNVSQNTRQNTTAVTVFVTAYLFQQQTQNYDSRSSFKSLNYDSSVHFP